MGIAAMNHFTVLSDDLEATRAFYELFGLVPGWRPPLGFPGLWLYVGDTPLLHVVQRDRVPADGVLDHMAFTATDLAGTVAILQREGREFSLRRVPGSGLWQLFVRDPSGAKVEFDFDKAEPAPEGYADA